MVQQSTTGGRAAVPPTRIIRRRYLLIVLFFGLYGTQLIHFLQLLVRSDSAYGDDSTKQYSEREIFLPAVGGLAASSNAASSNNAANVVVVVRPSTNNRHTTNPQVTTIISKGDSSSVLQMKTNNNKVVQKELPALLLQVPYYVYDERDAPLNWENFTFQGKFQYGSGDYVNDFKHSDDVWLYRASLLHPMRTKDPSKAKLFFLPLMLNAVASQDLCVDINATWKECFLGGDYFGKERMDKAYKFATKHLGRSKYFQRSKGKDHVVVHSHWAMPSHTTRKHALNLFKCNFINFENYGPVPRSNRVTIPSWYVGKPCHSSRGDAGERTHDFAMIAGIMPEDPRRATRGDICRWLQSGNYSVSHCGWGEQCPALAQAKYGFHARGDTWGSNRVMDLFLSRTIPLFTNPIQYDILPSFFVPLKNLTYLVDVSSEESFHNSLEKILSRPASEYLEKRRLIEDYIHIFDHRQIYQFDAYMAEFAERLSLLGLLYS